MVDGTDKVRDKSLLFEDGEGVGAEAVLGVVDVVVVGVVLEEGDEFGDALLDELIDVFIAGGGGDRAGVEGGGSVEALVVFIEGKDTGVVAEIGEGLGEFQGVDDATAGLSRIGE